MQDELVARGALVLDMANDMTWLTPAGWGVNFPSEIAVMGCSRDLLESSILYDAVKDSTPLSDIYSYRATENSLRRYENLSRLPDNFVVVGDAACAFNPVYAQGMSAAAVCALTLSEFLSQQRRHRGDGSLSSFSRGRSMSGFSLRFQKKLAKVNSTAWIFATSEDFRVPGVTGGTPDRLTRFMQHYVDQVVALSTESEPVRNSLLRVFNLLDDPQTLFNARIVMRIGRQVLTQLLGTLSGVRRSKTDLTDVRAASTYALK